MNLIMSLNVLIDLLHFLYRLFYIITVYLAIIVIFILTRVLILGELCYFIFVNFRIIMEFIISCFAFFIFFIRLLDFYYFLLLFLMIC